MKPPVTVNESPKRQPGQDCRCHHHAKPLSILEQVRCLADPRNRVAFSVGGIVGAFVPFAVFVLSYKVMGESHNPISAWDESTENKMLLGLIAAGGLFSAKSVYGWGVSAFASDKLKAIGYAVLIEGVLLLSPYLFLKILAGLYLLGINAIATGANLMERQGETVKRQPGTGPGESGTGPETPASEKPSAKKAHHRASTKRKVVAMKAQGVPVDSIVAATGASRRSVFRWTGAARAKTSATIQPAKGHAESRAGRAQ